MSPLIAFYGGTGTDHAGRTLEDILWKDDDWFERTHDFIQWLFPLTERSMYSAHSPLLTSEDIERFKTNKVLQDNLARASRRFTDFLVPVFATPRKQDHNYLRVTRYLKCMTLLGRKEHAKHVLSVLKQMLEKANVTPNSPTLEFWEAAVSGTCPAGN